MFMLTTSTPSRVVAAAKGRLDAATLAKRLSDHEVRADLLASVVEGEHQLPTIEERSALAALFDIPVQHLYHRAVAKVLKAEDEGGLTRMVASTAKPDRADDIVEQDWILDDFKENPVCPWGHDYSLLPVGRHVEMGVVGGLLMGAVEWDFADPFGARVGGQYRRGFLRAFSVGFSPGSALPRRGLPKDDPRYSDQGYGYVYGKNSLHENSAVMIGMNAQALAVRGFVSRATPEAFNVRAEVLRLLAEDAEVHRLLDDRALDVAENCGAIRKAKAEEASSRVLGRMFSLSRES